VVEEDPGHLNRTNTRQEEVNGGQGEVFGFDDHAPPGPDGARGCERSVLTERQLLGGAAEVADACYYDTPLEDGSPEMNGPRV